MNYDNYFPRGIAEGTAFCNREEERARLIKNIKSRQHTLLISPRRYGKTSLVRYAINELKMPFGEADLFVAVDAKRAEQRILAGIKNIMRNVGSSLEQTLAIIREFFKKNNTKWVVGTQGINLALIPDEQADPATNIMEALQALENLLAKKNQHALLFLDEIQEIGEIAEGKGIEGAIRHVAQQTKNLVLVFSGSNRHLLGKMFGEKSRPLYKLCERITINRINADHYKKHLNKLAQKRWGTKLSDETLEKIFTLTELHPFYMNCLCLRVWNLSNKKNMMPNDVEQIWYEFVKEERLETSRELSNISPGQRKLLIAISEGFNKELTGKFLLNKVNLSSSSVVEALKILEQNDYIEKQLNGEYRILDPLIKTSLNLYFGDNEIIN